ncbi:MAG: hypothetical protein ACLFSQ_09535 [Candidatus Zixiibacteriota bacterium]
MKREDTLWNLIESIIEDETTKQESEKDSGCDDKDMDENLMISGSRR